MAAEQLVGVVEAQPQQGSQQHLAQNSGDPRKGTCGGEGQRTQDRGQESLQIKMAGKRQQRHIEFLQKVVPREEHRSGEQHQKPSRYTVGRAQRFGGDPSHPQGDQESNAIAGHSDPQAEAVFQQDKVQPCRAEQ